MALLPDPDFDWSIDNSDNRQSPISPPPISPPPSRPPSHINEAAAAAAAAAATDTTYVPAPKLEVAKPADLPSSYATKLVTDIINGVDYAKKHNEKIYVIELDMDGCFLNGVVEKKNFAKDGIVNQDVFEMLRQIREYAFSQGVDICLNICSTACLDRLDDNQRKEIFSALSEISPNQVSFFQCSAGYSVGCVHEFNKEGKLVEKHFIDNAEFCDSSGTINKTKTIQFMRTLQKLSKGIIDEKRKILRSRNVLVKADPCTGVCFIDNSPDYFNKIPEFMKVQKLMNYSAIVDLDNRRVNYNPNSNNFREALTVEKRDGKSFITSVDRYGTPFTIIHEENQLDSCDDMRFPYWEQAKKYFDYDKEDHVPTEGEIGFVHAVGLGREFDSLKKRLGLSMQ